MSAIAKAIKDAAGPKPDLVLDDVQDIGYWCGMTQAADIAEKAEESLDEDDIIELMKEFFWEYVKYDDAENCVNLEIKYAHKIIDLVT